MSLSSQIDYNHGSIRIAARQYRSGSASRRLIQFAADTASHGNHQTLWVVTFIRLRCTTMKPAVPAISASPKLALVSDKSRLSWTQFFRQCVRPWTAITRSAAVVLLGILSTLSAQAQSPTGTDAASPDTAALLERLSDPGFGLRQRAVQDLLQQARTTTGLQTLGAALENHANPEAARRIIEVLELAWRDADFREPQAREISEILERAAVSRHWYLAEAARDILDRLWQRRVEIAIADLTRLKVPMEPRDPTLLWKASENSRSMFRSDPTTDQHLKIYIDETWPTDPRAFQLLQRLEGLAAWSRIGGGMVSLYKIDGNPLSVEQTALLKGIFGDLRIQERGRVCLGVLQDGLIDGGIGVPIGRVEKDSSADRAGLRSGDLIQALNGQKLRDFDDLVKLLRQFKVGDTITMTVIPQVFSPAQNFGVPFPPGERQNPDDGTRTPREVKVTLRGWYEPDSDNLAVPNPAPPQEPERQPE